MNYLDYFREPEEKPDRPPLSLPGEDKTSPPSERKNGKSGYLNYFQSPAAEPEPEYKSRPLAQFARGFGEGLTGIESKNLTPEQASEKVRSLGITGATEEELKRAAASISEVNQEAYNWQEKAASFTGRMMGELVGFIPALGAVGVATKGVKAASVLAKAGKYGKEAVKSGLAGGLQEVGQVGARELADEEQSAGRIAKDIGTSMAVFGGGDYFFRRVLIPAIKAGGGSVTRAINSYRGKNRPVKPGEAPPPGGVETPGGSFQAPQEAWTGPRAFNAQMEEAIRASGASVDDVARAVDDIAADPAIAAGFAKDANIPGKFPDGVRESMKAGLKERGVEKLTPEEVAQLRQNTTRGDLSDEVVQIRDNIHGAEVPQAGTTLPKTAIKVETITDSQGAAKVVGELMQPGILPPPKPMTLAQMNMKLAERGIQNFDDAALPQVISEIGLQLRAMDAVARETWNSLYKLSAEKAGPDQFKKVLTNGVNLLRHTRDARSEFGRQFRGLQPDARISGPAARQLRKEQEQLLKRIDNYFGKDGELPPDFLDAIKHIDGNNPDEVIALLDMFRSPSVWSRLTSFRINNLVSSPRTAVINVTGNLVQNSIASAKRPIAAAWDAALTPFYKAVGHDVGRERFLRESTGLYAMTEEMGNATRAAMRMLVDGTETLGSSKIDIPGLAGQRVSRVLSDPLRKGEFNKALYNVDKWVLGLPARMNLGVMDEFQKVLGLAINRRALAAREILKKNPNASREELGLGVTKLLGGKKDPSEIATLRALGRVDEADFAALANQIDDEAVSATLKNVFQSKDSRVANALMKLRDDPAANPLGATGNKAMQLIFPFLRTPIQLAERGFELNPLYQATRIGFKLAGRGGFHKYASKGELADDMAMLTMGIPLSWMAVNLVASGKMTGSRLFLDENVRKIEANTKKPFTFYMNGKGLEYGRIDPPAFAMAITANLAEAYLNEKLLITPWELGNTVFRSFGTVFKDKLYLKTISDMVEVFSSTDDEDRWARVMSRSLATQATQFLPYSSLISSIGRRDDPHRFRAEGPGEALTRRYGTGSDKVLFGYHNMLGEKIFDVLEPTSGGREIWNFISPFRTTEPVSEDIVNEMVRLNITANVSELHRKANGISYTPAEFANVNENLRNAVVPALEAVIRGDRSPQGMQKLVAALGPDPFKARIKAYKYIQAYHMLPDDRYSVPAYRGEYKEPLTKEGVIMDIMESARKQARQGTWKELVAPRLLEAGLTPQDVNDIRRGIKEQEDFGLHR